MLMMNFLQSFELGVYTLGESGWESLPTNGALSRAGAVFFADPTRKELVLAGGDASATTQALGYGATAFARADLRPGIRSRLGAAFDPVNGVPLLFAGMNTATAQNDTWTYDGNRFHRIDSYSHPFVSGNEGVRYGGFAYSFGGVSAGGWTNELRRFTGTSWTVVTTSGTAPSARGESALAWDEQANVVVLFGGTGPSGVLGDTFVLNGTTWSQPALAFGPPARFGHAMAYDRVRGGVVLFGGDVDDLSHTPPFGDTWLFKNNVWQDISASVGPGPGPRTHHQMTTDPISGRPLLFGGLKPGGAQDNVLWELADDGWSVVDALDAPPFVYRGVLVDDPVRKHVVLFGGNGRDEAYHLERAFGGRPAITFHVDLTPLGLSDAQIIEVGFSAVAGGEGIAATGASVPGATLELFRLGRWSRMAENDAPLGALAPLSTTGLTAYEALVGNSLHLALAARAENGAEAATVEVDHVEVRVRYLR